MAISVSILGDSRVVSEDSSVVRVTFLTNNPVPPGELILVDFEIIPGTATPQQDYLYQSPSAVFIRQTGVYADRISIPSGASLGSLIIDILQDNDLEGDETFTIKITGVSPTVQIGENSLITITINDAEDVEAANVIYRINAGGPDIAAIDGGPNWVSDAAFLLNPDSSSVFLSPLPITTGSTVPTSTPNAIFASERFDPVFGINDPRLEYFFPVDSGLYEVRLYFADTFENTSVPGQRIFDVALENEILPELNNLDIAAQFGPLVGGMISSQVVVRDGILNLKFVHDALDGIENPFVSGIEIIQLEAIATPPTVAIASVPYIVDEANQFAKVTLLTSAPVLPQEVVTISFEILPGSATPLEDYQYNSVTATFDAQTGIYRDQVTIPSGFSTAGILVDILPDAITEGSEAFTVTITGVEGNFQLGANSSTTVTIRDDGFIPTTFRIEAEDTVSHAYDLAAMQTASAGHALVLDGSAHSGVGLTSVSLNTISNFTPGVYDLAVGLFDPLLAGGMAGSTLAATFKLALNGSVISEISLGNSPAEGVNPTSATVEYTVATGVALGATDTLSLIGVESSDALLWLDYLQFSSTLL